MTSQAADPAWADFVFRRVANRFMGRGFNYARYSGKAAQCLTLPLGVEVFGKGIYLYNAFASKSFAHRSAGSAKRNSQTLPASCFLPRQEPNAVALNQCASSKPSFLKGGKAATRVDSSFVASPAVSVEPEVGASSVLTSQTQQIMER